MSGAADKRGFLLLGFPRSGTTLLSRLLGGHRDVSCPPETYLFSAAARFLHEQDRVEGPPIGVLSGLAFAGFAPEEVLQPLRDMVFGFHARMAGDRPVWVEKTAVDVFHLETLRELLDGHVRFIVLERNPLDVIVSNLGLAQVMGAQLHDLFEMTREINSPHEGIARAWADRAGALRKFVAEAGEDACVLRYEDLTTDPVAELDRLFAFMGVTPEGSGAIERAFATDSVVGLGDFNFDSTTQVRPARPNAWKGKIPPAVLARILPILAEQMELSGYPVPRAPRIPAREDAVRQLQMAAALKRDHSRTSDGS